MDDKKRDNIEIYVFVGVVALIIFLGYDGFVNEDAIPEGRRRGGSKSRLGSLIVWSIWKIGHEYPWLYIAFRGLFLAIALWMGFKIYKAVYVKNRK